MENEMILAVGSSGPAVLLLQNLLTQLGEDIEADGKFGPKTQAALRSVMERFIAIRTHAGDDSMMMGERQELQSEFGTLGRTTAANLAALFQPSSLGASIAQTEATKLPALHMTSPDSAEALYPDKAANGGNNDEDNRTKFLNLVLADPRSKLAQMKAALLKEIGDDARGEGVYFGTWQSTFHDRNGASESLNSYSAVVVTVTGGDSNHTATRYLVTIDDDDHGGVRRLSLRSIQPCKIRDEPPSQ